ncbi:MAG: thioredoxin family protein [Proteobacteria bacterium]|nr:thioredoxin family protein [Pseudomonadota bacterium]
MKKAIPAILLVAAFLVAFPAVFCRAEGPLPEVPTPGLVTMVDLGAHKCIPCKMMAPLIKELQAEYAGRASVIFIDVWENRDQAKRFGIRGIPTQIFYDREGGEVERHVGFLDKKSIQDMFTRLGVPPAEGAP